MSLKNELKRDLRNVMKDVEKEANRMWKADYQGHEIVVKNGLREERLFVDGILITKNERASLWSHIIPYVTLSGTFTSETGEVKKIEAKIGGIIKFNCTITVDGEKVLMATEKFELYPWRHKESLYAVIQHQLQTEGKLVTDELPDDEYVYDENHPRIEPGLADLLNEDITLPFFVKGLVRSFSKQVHEPSDKTRLKTYESVMGDTVASYHTNFIKQLTEEIQQHHLTEEDIQREAIWLLEHGTHREIVKFSLVVLSCTSCDAYRDQILTVGRHEEFTLYAVHALKNGCSDSDKWLFALAQHVKGWGRVHVIEALEAETPEVREWLLTEGYHSTIGDGFSAYECAKKGRLGDVLKEPSVSHEMYEHANTLLQAVFDGTSPDPLLTEIDDGAEWLIDFTRHAQVHCKTLHHFYTITLIERFLEDEIDPGDARFIEEEVWITETAYRDLLKKLRELTDQRKWLSQAVDVLEERFDRPAVEVANFYHLNVSAKLLRHLTANPLELAIYQTMMAGGVQQDIATLCEFANEHLNIQNPSDIELECIGTILENLEMYDAVGLPFIVSTLHSSQQTIQYDALLALSYWDSDDWANEAVISTIKELTKSTYKDVRSLARELLR